MHHMNSEEVNTFWAFDRKRSKEKPNEPLLIRDIYREYLAPALQGKRLDWDNFSNDRYYLDLEDKDRNWEDWKVKRMKKRDKYNEFETRAHKSYDDCLAACKSLDHDECFQFQYTDGQCSFSKAFKMGKPVKKEKDAKKRLASGWDVAKINAWINKQGNCNNVKWPGLK
jgi:hypothetical protein